MSFAAIGIFTAAAALAATAPSFAAGGQAGMLSGMVVDSSNVAVANAEVVAVAPTGRYTAHTDKRGKFTIVGATQDTYTITIQEAGYAKLVEPNVDVVGDQTVSIGTVTLQRT